MKILLDFLFYLNLKITENIFPSDFINSSQKNYDYAKQFRVAIDIICTTGDLIAILFVFIHV